MSANPDNTQEVVKIRLCFNNMPSAQELKITVIHELVHAVDYCNCRSYLLGEEAFWSESDEDYWDDIACMEILASALDGGCAGRATEAEREDCVKKRAISSTQHGLGIDEKDAIDAVARVFQQCYIPKKSGPKKKPMPVPPWPSGRPYE